MEEGAPERTVFPRCSRTVFHCCSGAAETAEICAAAGSFMSFAGDVTLKRRHRR